MPSTSSRGLRTLFENGHNHPIEMLDTMLPEVQRKTASIARLRHYPAGHILLRDGEESGEVGYIVEGALAMTKRLSDEKEHVIGVLLPTDMYGRLFEGPSGYQIGALTKVAVVTLDRVGFEAILRQDPLLERLFFISVLDELDAAREWVLMLNGHHVVGKVAAFLLFLLRRELESAGKADASPIVKVPMNRGDFARCLAIRPESLSRALHDLAGEGLIHLVSKDEFRILDLPRLVELAGNELAGVPPPAGHGRER